MVEIENWFETKDYNSGVELYSSLKGCNKKLVNSFRKRKNQRNQSLLEYELSKKLKSLKIQSQSTPKIVFTPKKIVDTTTQLEYKNEIVKRSDSEAEKIKYNILPHDLKQKYRVAINLFYDMCDLKEVLNDVPKETESKALSIQIQIRKKDEEKMLIWKELKHYQKHKVRLVTDTTKDLSKESLEKLHLMLRNNRSYITKTNNRINGWYEALETAKGLEAHKLEIKIQKGESAVHNYEMDIVKIKSILKID